MKHTVAILAIAALNLLAFSQERARRRPRENAGAKLHRFSTTVEKERPQLNEETKRLISAYQRNPTTKNKATLKKQCEINYDRILERKKAKLEELKQTARHKSKVDEMQEIVDEMVKNREYRVAQTLARFTDPRFRNRRQKDTDGYLPLLGAKSNVSIAYAPVTEAEYARYSKRQVKSGNEDYPVREISLSEISKYCTGLNGKDPAYTYRIPTEAEWELAAGHMPKDADFNCGEKGVVTSVNAYSQTKGASGGIDFWGNCWEWTSTSRGNGRYAVKGGAFDSKRTECRTEAREAVRNGKTGYSNVTFRLVREKKGK